MSGHFIQGILSRPGSKGQLHRDLGIPTGQKIPRGLLEQAARRGDIVGRRARFALELESFNGRK